MVVFPNAKINLGLNIISRRPDGYHDLDMVMMPVGWCDILEIVPSKGTTTSLTVSGRPVACPPEENLVYKAWDALNDALDGSLPPVDIYLRKIIPDGAGLGGGSSDAAFTLRVLNEMFSLELDDVKLCELAATLGADCPFFIHNRPMLCRGTGTEMTPVYVNLEGVSHIVIAKPRSTGISTAEAYGCVKPSMPATSTDVIVSRAPQTWQGTLVNGFEDHIFRLKPEIGAIKELMLSSGAVYASMSGSGSAVYGLFDNVKMADNIASRMKTCDCFAGKFP